MIHQITTSKGIWILKSLLPRVSVLLIITSPLYAQETAPFRRGDEMGGEGVVLRTHEFVTSLFGGFADSQSSLAVAR